jgi:hypothetical protein
MGYKIEQVRHQSRPGLPPQYKLIKDGRIIDTSYNKEDVVARMAKEIEKEND